jgi:UDP-4-amino-4,6-dideoxy-N-acetyl-beta-L-altrosamine transaminase
MKPIPYGRHYITEQDIAAVVDVLRSDFLTQGPCVAEFEAMFAAYVGAPYAVAVTNGTAALHLSVLALGILPGQKVITTPITFAATANCARFVGAEVVFADIDPETYLLDIRNVEALLAAAPRGAYAAIIPVEFAGKAVDLAAFRHLADAYGCRLIEDACHAPGGYFTDPAGQKQYCGNGRFADTSIFSFHPVKHIAAGEGGMITTASRTLYEQLRNLRTHGIQQIPEKREQDAGVWYYEMQMLGYNYRLTDMQAALGSSQLKRAEQGLQRRHQLAKAYHDAFAAQAFITHLPAYDQGNAYHLFVAEFKDRDGLILYLREQGIYAQVHYIPLHLMPYYRDLGWRPGDFPCAEAYYRGCLSLPLYPSLRDDEQQYVIKSVFDFYG